MSRYHAPGHLSCRRFEGNDVSSDEDAMEHESDFHRSRMALKRSGYDPWVHENWEELVDLYDVFVQRGRHTFGEAFNQKGRFGDFLVFVYSRMQP